MGSLSARTVSRNTARSCGGDAKSCRCAKPTDPCAKSRSRLTMATPTTRARRAASLAAAGLPAMFFITVGRVGERAEVWWDRLEQILLEGTTTASTIEIEIGGRPLWIDIRSPSARERAHQALFWRLRPMRPAVIESVLADLEELLGIRTVDRETYRWMTAAELRALSASDGWKSAHTHSPIPFLPRSSPRSSGGRLRAAAVRSKRCWKRPRPVFAYPYGGRDAFNPVTTQLVRDVGYTMACTTAGGIARADCDPLQIPRNVVGDWDAERFEEWLDRWLTTA